MSALRERCRVTTAKPSGKHHAQTRKGRCTGRAHSMQKKMGKIKGRRRRRRRRRMPFGDDTGCASQRNAAAEIEYSGTRKCTCSAEFKEGVTGRLKFGCTTGFAELDRILAAEPGLDRRPSTGLVDSPRDVADHWRCIIPTASSLSVQGSIPSSFSVASISKGHPSVETTPVQGRIVTRTRGNKICPNGKWGGDGWSKGATVVMITRERISFSQNSNLKILIFPPGGLPKFPLEFASAVGSPPGAR